MMGLRGLLWCMVLAAASAALACSGCRGGGSGGQADASWPSVSLVRAAEGFSEPLDILHAGDGSGRLFVVERGGKVWIVEGGTKGAAPFLDISDRVETGGSEQGLLGLAFPPGYGPDKRYFYAHYSRLGDGATVLSRFGLASDSLADPSSEAVLLTQSQPHSNHNGGQIVFGPDGYLYMGLGDGGSSGDPHGNGQNQNTFLGKLLRIDTESGASPYALPPDNPFGTEVWALGLRNPWKFSFDPQTGGLYIADVGQNEYEEIDLHESGEGGGVNYGWSIMEGAHCYDAETCGQTGLTLPVWEYDHSEDDCSITGGHVYRGTAYPSLEGIYLYADFCTGRIWGLRKTDGSWESSRLYNSGYLISTFGLDEDGELYLADYSDGGIYRVGAE